MKRSKTGVLLILVVALIAMALSLGSGSSSDSDYGDYYYNDIDKNNDGNLSDSEFQNAVTAFMDENGY